MERDSINVASLKWEVKMNQLPKRHYSDDNIKITDLDLTMLKSSATGLNPIVTAPNYVHGNWAKFKLRGLEFPLPP